MNRRLPKRQRLKQLLRYNLGDGAFYWRTAPNGRITIGQRAGCINANGYRSISIDGTTYVASALALLYVDGRRYSMVDHKNLVRDDDRYKNLRPATRSQNGANRRRYKNNKSGFKGVDFRKGLWRTQIKKNGVTRHIGYFKTPGSAHRAYLKEARKMHGRFARSR